MSILLDPNNLPEVLFENSSSTPCIIYVGVGTHLQYGKDWEHKYNQQFPAFIHDWKINNSSTRIKIILFDGMENDIPYILRDAQSFYSNTFHMDSKYSNVFRSDYGIEVYNFRFNVNWFNNYLNREGYFDISNIIIQIMGKIGRGYLFFYHEFTGRNPELLECEINQIINFNDRRICIDISRGRDLSCMVDFSEPENYPLILSNGSDDIEWLNVKNLSIEKQFELIDNFSGKISKDFYSVVETTCPYLHPKVFEYYMFKQIINKNMCVKNICKKILYGIKSFYEMSRDFTIYDYENLKNIQLLKTKVVLGSEKEMDNIKKLSEYIEMLKSCFDATTSEIYRTEGLKIIKQILFDCIKNIKKIPEEIIRDLFGKFDITVDKYRLVGIFNNFMDM
jgi:hypothetical protein